MRPIWMLSIDSSDGQPHDRGDFCDALWRSCQISRASSLLQLGSLLRPVTMNRGGDFLKHIENFIARLDPCFRTEDATPLVDLIRCITSLQTLDVRYSSCDGIILGASGTLTDAYSY